jgi:hypothetical protein
MIYSAMVESLSPDIEEEVSVIIGGQNMTCFATCLPYPLELGKTYFVELSPMVFDEYRVRETTSSEPRAQRIGAGYSYVLTGNLMRGYLDCGRIVIYDEGLLADFSHLDGAMISWEVDRLDILFS